LACGTICIDDKIINPTLYLTSCKRRQVFHLDNSSSAPSLLLHFDNDRYMFNFGEGAQRMLREYKKKISKACVEELTPFDQSTPKHAH
jgi:hypothetical protein